MALSWCCSFSTGQPRVEGTDELQLEEVLASSQPRGPVPLSLNHNVSHCLGPLDTNLHSVPGLLFANFPGQQHCLEGHDIQVCPLSLLICLLSQTSSCPRRPPSSFLHSTTSSLGIHLFLIPVNNDEYLSAAI